MNTTAVTWFTCFFVNVSIILQTKYMFLHTVVLLKFNLPPQSPEVPISKLIPYYFSRSFLKKNIFFLILGGLLW